MILDKIATVLFWVAFVVTGVIAVGGVVTFAVLAVIGVWQGRWEMAVPFCALGLLALFGWGIVRYADA